MVTIVSVVTSTLDLELFCPPRSSLQFMGQKCEELVVFVQTQVLINISVAQTCCSDQRLFAQAFRCSLPCLKPCLFLTSLPESADSTHSQTKYMLTMLLFAKYSLVSTAGATKRVSKSQRKWTFPYRSKTHNALGNFNLKLSRCENFAFHHI